MITSDESFYILRFDRNAYAVAVDSGVDTGDEGIEEAFDMIAEIPEVYVTVCMVLMQNSANAVTSG